MTRTEALASIKSAIKSEFKGVIVETNETMNPGTPMCAIVTFGGKLRKVIKAKSLNETSDDFLGHALPTLRAFKQQNVPTAA